MTETSKPGEMSVNPKNGRQVVCNGIVIGTAASTPSDPPHAWATARLWAAAPDLLAACEAAQEELRLIRMKDTDAVYNPLVRSILEAATLKATHPKPKEQGAAK